SIDNFHDAKCTYWDSQWMPTLVYELPLQEGDSISATKYAAIYTSREVRNPVDKASSAVVENATRDFGELVRESQSTWDELWDRSNVIIRGDDFADRALRYNLFQILIAAPRYDETVSIGAKTLSGYGYRGHVFWDTEIFVLPFLIYTQPDIARNVLMYRYHTLAGARKKAEKNGYQGAMYAWESADTGEEVTPTWIIDNNDHLIRIWSGDLEQHITADVAYGVNLYWKVSGDDVFMRDFGAEIVLSAAMFYASRLERDKEDNLYHMRDVIGPDEYHEHVDDNAMTNLMCAWCLRFAQEVAHWLKTNYQQNYEKLLSQLNLNQVQIQSWREMQEKIVITTRTDGIIEQFDGYFDLKYLDLASLEPRNLSLQSLFGIEGVQEYQFIKQPDVVMALHLLKDSFSQTSILQNLAYYTPRTDLTQGSSLGPSIQSLMLARYGDVGKAKDLFIKTLLTDLANNRGNTGDGIHAASAGAVYQVILFGFLGYEVKEDRPRISPKLPPGWEGISMKIILKGQQISFDTI
ncbi:MAG: glycoside hydrolase family 65 protein, partial [Anaerolineales bacterium]